LLSFDNLCQEHERLLMETMVIITFGLSHQVAAGGFQNLISATSPVRAPAPSRSCVATSGTQCWGEALDRDIGRDPRSGCVAHA
jgi:hypothetical protein